MTAKKVSEISGISVRTLQYYDEVGLLSPIRDKENNYRIYADNDLDKLQQIMFFKRCGFSLSTIKELLSDTMQGKEQAFLLQRNLLLLEKERLDGVIMTLENSLKAMRGEIIMSNEDKFKNLKEQMISDNEEKYGKEVCERYGKETIAASNEYLRSMPKETFESITQLNDRVLQLLTQLVGDPYNEGKLKELALAHKEWLILSWGSVRPYSKEAHLGLCEMYIYDERFTNYYGGIEPVEILKQAVEKYV